MDWSPLSASQLETWKLCHRRWFFAYVLRRPRPPNRFAEFGLTLHAMAERWLRDGEMPDPRRYAPGSPSAKAAASLLKGVPHMPSPSTPGLVVEAPWTLTYDGVEFQGVVDYAAPEAPHLTRYLPIVGDHKSTGAVEWDEGPDDDLTTHAIRCAFSVPNRGPDPRPNTPDRLIGNVQAILYALAAMRIYRTDTVALNWVHYLRREPGAMPVRESDGTVPFVQLGDVQAFVDANVMPRAEEIITLRRKADVLKASDVEPNPASCFAFGGPCPHMGECGLWTRPKGNNQMSLAAILAKKSGAAAPSPKQPAAGAVALKGKAPPWQGAASRVNPPQAEPEAEEAPPVAEDKPKTSRKPRAAKAVPVQPEPETAPEGEEYGPEELIEIACGALDELVQSEDQSVRDCVAGMLARYSRAVK